MKRKATKSPEVTKSPEWLKYQFEIYEARWKEFRDPLTAWDAWYLCDALGLELPKWLRGYFNSCAEKIVKEAVSLLEEPIGRRARGSKAPTPRERDAAVARALGF